MAEKNDSGKDARIGLSTYALFWEGSDRNPDTLTVPDMIERTAGLECNVLQLCDWRAVETMSAERLAGHRHEAERSGVDIEIGTRGLGKDHIARYLRICEALDAHVLRSMIVPEGDDPIGSACRSIEALLPGLRDLDVCMCLETYEQISSSALVSIVKRVGDPHVAIALDPANTVANFENPNDVIKCCAEATNNLHVKDFAFTRMDGLIGFSYSGARMGEGGLDYSFEMKEVRPVQRGISQIVEHWLPWQGDIDTTIKQEREWTSHAVKYIKENQ